jgi:hypothetical protein
MIYNLRTSVINTFNNLNFSYDYGFYFIPDFAQMKNLSDKEFILFFNLFSKINNKKYSSYFAILKDFETIFKKLI